MTADTVGGIWHYAMELAAGLRALGAQTLLMTEGGPLQRWQREQAASIPDLHIIETAHRLEWMDEPWSSIANARQTLRRLEERFAPDVIHLNSYSLGSAPTRAPRVVVGHSCVYSWWHAVFNEEPPPKYTRYRHEVAWGLTSADHVVAPTAWMLEQLQRHYGHLEHKSVIFNGSQKPATSPAPKRAEILAVGRVWDNGKNLSLLEKVSPELGWPIRVIGSEKSPAGDSVALRGLRALGALSHDEVRHWMSRATVFLHPALYEPFGLAPLEAAHAGCALVLSDIPPLREIWDDAALYVDPRQPEAWRDAIVNSMNDTRGTSSLANRAKRRAGSYSRRAMADNYMRLYEQLVKPVASSATFLPRSDDSMWFFDERQV